MDQAAQTECGKEVRFEMSTRRAMDAQFDLFVPYVSELPMRDQRETMERPFFSLSKRKRIKPIEYVSPNGEVFVNVFPNAEFGMATIWDVDVLIWAASTINNLRKKGANDLPRTLHFQPYDLLKTISRDTGGREYRLLREALGRLQATTIVTNIRVKKGKKQRQFSWIESWTDLQDEETQQSKGMSITLSDWFYEGVLMDGGLLAIDPLYFSITGGRERWLYRVARKHAGGAGEAGFAISLPTLFEKSGAEGTYRRFKFELQAIAKRNKVPGYALGWEVGEGEPFLRMTRRDPQGHQAEVISFDALSLPQPAFSSPAPSGRARNHEELTDETIERVRHAYPGRDVYMLKAEFDRALDEQRVQKNKDYQSSYWDFVQFSCQK